MQTLVHIKQTTDLQLTDDDNDKLRIGIAWDASSPNSRRAYQLAWRQLNDFLSAKGETLDNITDANTRIGPFIEQVSNQKRSHSVLGYLTPIEFDQKNLS